MTSLTLQLRNLVQSHSETFEKEDSALITRQMISYVVFPVGRERINLTTNEVFLSPSYARLLTKDKVPILGRLSVFRVASSDEFELGTMQYFESLDGTVDFDSTDAEIEFRWFMKEENFDLLLANIRAGMRPAEAHVDFGYKFDMESAMQYDWAPDGSEKKWDVSREEDRTQRFESLGFKYLDPRPEDDETEDGVFEVPAITPSIQPELTGALAGLRTSFNVIIGLLFVIGLAISFGLSKL